jgi:hypothetical protein
MSEHTGWEQQAMYQIYVCSTETVFVSGVSSILVVVLFILKAKARKCLRYADCNHLELRNQDRNVDSSNSLKIFHQCISRLRNKPDESIPKNR